MLCFSSYCKSKWRTGAGCQYAKCGLFLTHGI